MSPETPESRLLHVERDIAILGQSFQDMRDRVRDLLPLAVSVTRLESAASTLQSELLNIRRELDEREKSRSTEARADTRTVRAALWALTTAITVTIMGAIIAYFLSAH